MGRELTSLQRPTTDDRDAWYSYWKAQGQSWRTEPEIDKDRQDYLKERSTISPDIEHCIYPFKDIKLKRADVEWLLATYEKGHRLLDWSNVNQQEHEGLDLRGADLRGEDLHNLPLVGVYGGLTGEERGRLTSEQREAATAHLEKADLSGAHLERARFWSTHLEEANLRGAHLEQADLFFVHLERADLDEAHLEGADLSRAHLEGASLNEAHLEGVHFSEAHLEGATLLKAHLERAYLFEAHLEGTYLGEAHLEGAHLFEAHLERSRLIRTHLEGRLMHADDLDRVRRWVKDFPAILPPADLRSTFFDTSTQFTNVILGDEQFGFVSLADVRWGGMNLTLVNWELVKELGDTRLARQSKNSRGEVKGKDEQFDDYRVAVRANRQLADALQVQGLHEEAARFAYSAKKAQQQALWLYAFQRKLNLSQRLRTLTTYVFFLFLDLLAGYGYKPMRSLFWYLVIILGFTTLYYAFGHIPPLEAFVFSLTSFHGRGFFPGNNISLSDPRIVLAAIEAVMGLFIEISFIATFTQRFFGK